MGRLVTSLRRDLDQEGLMAGNRHLQTLLRRGKKFNAKHRNGTTKPIYAELIDFQRPEKNSFVAVNQMRVTRGPSVRPDVTLLVNGLPLVQMELKSLAQDNDYTDAIADLREYEATVPRLFFPSLLNVTADTEALRYGAVGARPRFYFPWADAPLRYQDENDLRQAVQALLNPETLLDVLQNYVFYEQKEGGTAKIVPRHMQYYAVREILGRIREGESDVARSTFRNYCPSGEPPLHRYSIFATRRRGGEATLRKRVHSASTFAWSWPRRRLSIT